MARLLLISLLASTALFLAPGCALMDAFDSPVNDDPDPGSGDDEPGDDEPGDDEPGDGEDPIEPGECEPGETRHCDCLFDDPAAGVFPGEESCGHEESWGECICPETCTTESGDSVYHGQPCGFCEISLFSCDAELAACPEFLDTNLCGACPPSGELPLHPDCDVEEAIYCDQDQEPFCSAPSDTPLRVDLTGVDRESGDRVFYSFVAGVGPGTGCADGWEFPVAHAPPSAYQEAPTAEFNGVEAFLPPESDSISSGVLRVLIQKSVPLFDQTTNTSAPAQVTTHFGCAPLFLGEDSLEVEPHLHPYLFQGPYELAFRLNNYVEFPTSTESQFLFSTLHPWTRNALIGAPDRPQALLFGCPASICGSDHAFVSLFDQFHVERTRADVPIPSFWPDFYNRYSALLAEGDNADLLHQVYEELYQEWLELYSAVTAPIPATNYLFWRSRVITNRRALVNLTDFDSIHHLDGAHVGAAIFADGIDLGRQSDHPPFERIMLTGNDPQVYQIPLPIQGFQSAQRSLSASFDSELSNLILSPASYPIRGDAAARYLLFDYLPRYLIPDVLQEDDGQFVTSTYQTFADNLEMHRTLFPCSEVQNRLETAGMEADDLDRFTTLCDEIYGDPDGPGILSVIQDLFPLEKEGWTHEYRLTGETSCPVRFEADSLVGFRLRDFGAETSCSLQNYTRYSLPPQGIPDSATPYGVYLTLTRQIPAAPTEF